MKTETQKSYIVTFSRSYEVSEEMIFKRLALAGKLTERPDEDEMEKENEAEQIARSWFEAEMSENCEDSTDFASAVVEPKEEYETKINDKY